MKLVRHAFDRNVQFFDAAEIYGRYIAEEIAGKALKFARDDVVLCTKFGFDLGSDGASRGMDSRPDVSSRKCQPAVHANR